MSTTVVTIPLSAIPAYLNGRAGLLSRPATFVPLYQQLQVLAISDTRENFLSGSDPDGSPWAALVRRQGEPLLDKGILWKSVQSSVGPEGLSLWTNVPYAAVHQFGAAITLPDIVPKKAKALRWYVGGKPVFAKRVKGHTVNVPRRRFLGFGRRFFAKAMPVMETFVAKLLGE